MKTLKILLIALFFTVSLYAQRVNLDTPVHAKPGVSKFHINSFAFDKKGQAVTIGLVEVDNVGVEVEGGETMTFSYNGAVAVGRIDQFITFAFKRGILQQLQADGKLGSGQVTGGP